MILLLKRYQTFVFAIVQANARLFHRCSNDKLNNNNVKIIEFKIKTEEDARSLAWIDIMQNVGTAADKGIYDKKEIGIQFHKFKDEGMPQSLTRFTETNITRVALWRTGYIGIERLNCREVNNLKNPQNNELVAIRFLNPRFTKDYQAKRYLANKGIGNYRSCYWCRNSYSPQSGCTFCSCFPKLEIDRVNQTYLPYHCGKYDFLAYSDSTEVYLKDGATLEQIQQQTQIFPQVPVLPATFDKSLLEPIDHSDKYL